MKTLITTLLFLAVIGMLSFSWMEQLVDSKLLFHEYLRSRQTERLHDGQAEWRDYQGRRLRPLNIAAMVIPDEHAPFSQEERLWFVEVLAAILCEAHPKLAADRANASSIAYQVIEMLHNRRSGSAQPALPAELSSYTGKVRCAADLLAIPIPSGEQRALWIDSLLGVPPAKMRLIQWLSVDDSWSLPPITSLPQPILRSLIGEAAARKIHDTPPEQRYALLLEALSPTAQELIENLVDLDEEEEDFDY